VDSKTQHTFRLLSSFAVCYAVLESVTTTPESFRATQPLNGGSFYAQKNLTA
jgi:hypothetical protein